MKIFIKIALSLLTVVLLFFAIGVFLPNNFHVERSIVVDAPMQFIHSKLNGFGSFNQWSPWAEKDPNANYSFEGPEQGIGAKMAWASEVKEVGKGTQEIIESSPQKITYLLTFDGMQPSNASFLFEEAENGTNVTWTLDADMGSDIIGRYFGLFFDKMLGPDYEKGLKNLKTYIESQKIFENEIVIEETESKLYISITEYVDNDPGLISTKMASNFGALMSYLQNSGVEIKGYPFAFYHNYTNVGMDIECAIGLNEAIEITDDKMKINEFPEGRAVKAIHLGSFDNLESTHAEISEFIEFKKLEMVGSPYEVYITDPEMETDTSKWITHIYYPIK